MSAWFFRERGRHELLEVAEHFRVRLEAGGSSGVINRRGKPRMIDYKAQAVSDRDRKRSTDVYLVGHLQGLALLSCRLRVRLSLLLQVSLGELRHRQAVVGGGVGGTR